MSRDDFADEAEFADLHDLIHLRAGHAAGRHGRAVDARHNGLEKLRHSCGTSGRLIFFDERGAHGNLPAQFRPEPFQPRQQPVVPNPNAIGVLHNHAAIRSSPGRRKSVRFNGERPVRWRISSASLSPNAA